MGPHRGPSLTTATSPSSVSYHCGTAGEYLSRVLSERLAQARARPCRRAAAGDTMAGVLGGGASVHWRADNAPMATGPRGVTRGGDGDTRTIVFIIARQSSVNAICTLDSIFLSRAWLGYGLLAGFVCWLPYGACWAARLRRGGKVGGGQDRAAALSRRAARAVLSHHTACGSAAATSSEWCSCPGLQSTVYDGRAVSGLAAEQLRATFTNWVSMRRE